MLYLPSRHYTFGNFKIRPGNLHARAESVNFATCQRPKDGAILILAGKPSAGKTHLLNATANMAKDNTCISSHSTVSAHRFAEEVQRAIIHRDRFWVKDRFATEDFLAIDDVDHLYALPDSAELLISILILRMENHMRTLLTLTLSNARNLDCPLSRLLDKQWAIPLL
jgi:chromosomal replication initiation ATPase DnaA